RLWGTPAHRMSGGGRIDPRMTPSCWSAGEVVAGHDRIRDDSRAASTLRRRKRFFPPDGARARLPVRATAAAAPCVVRPRTPDGPGKGGSRHARAVPGRGTGVRRTEPTFNYRDGGRRPGPDRLLRPQPPTPQRTGHGDPGPGRGPHQGREGPELGPTRAV